MREKFESDLICPIEKSKFIKINKNYFISKKHKYPIISGIPCLYVDGKLNSNNKKTQFVKKFYMKNPFPNYNEFDNVKIFSEKAKKGVFVKLLSEQIGTQKKILEIGCGTGQLSNYLSATTFSNKIYATDISLNSLKLANKFKNLNNLIDVNFFQMNLFHPCFRKNSMDIVISNGVLHHTYNPFKAFQEITSLVKPGGCIIISLYNYLGRLITKFNKLLYKMFGEKGLLFDTYIKNQISKEKKKAWMQDQYNHPLESTHSFNEVINKWFKNNKITFISSIPKVVGDFSEKEKLFEKNNHGDIVDKFNTEFEMIVDHKISEGGLFTIIGKKIIK